MTLNDPYPSSRFAADGQDILIGGLSESIGFQMRVNGVTILSETYNYDSQGQVAVRGIADVVARCLYGTLALGSQNDARATVDFLIDGAVVYTHTLYSSRLQNPADPQGAKALMAVAARTVCRPGTPHVLTFIGGQTASLRDRQGNELRSVSVGQPGTVYAEDCDPVRLFPADWQRGATVSFCGGEQVADIAGAACDDCVPVRFLNRYDVPESVVAAYIDEKPQAQDEVSMMYSRRVRFSVKSSTDYTLRSGPLRHPGQYDSWQDLLTSRKAQVWMHGQWIDIVITKSNYSRPRRRHYGTQVELTFQTTNPYLTL